MRLTPLCTPSFIVDCLYRQTDSSICTRVCLVLCLTLCHFVLVFFSPFSIAITSLGVERANLSAFRTFVRFVLVWIRRFPLPLGVWEGLLLVIVALPGFFSYLFFCLISSKTGIFLIDLFFPIQNLRMSNFCH